MASTQEKAVLAVLSRRHSSTVAEVFGGLSDDERRLFAPSFNEAKSQIAPCLSRLKKSGKVESRDSGIPGGVLSWVLAVPAPAPEESHPAEPTESEPVLKPARDCPTNVDAFEALPNCATPLLCGKAGKCLDPQGCEPHPAAGFVLHDPLSDPLVEAVCEALGQTEVAGESARYAPHAVDPDDPVVASNGGILPVPVIVPVPVHEWLYWRAQTLAEAISSHLTAGLYTGEHRASLDQWASELVEVLDAAADRLRDFEKALGV